MLFFRTLAFAPLLALASCSSNVSSSPNDAGPSDGSVPFDALVDAGACGVTTARFDPNPAFHVDQGSALTHASNPPCGGNHYPIWVTWGAHSEPVPRGNWIHNLEHGGVVFLYNCANRSSCPEVASKLEALAAALPQDPVCAGQSPPIRNRVVVTADPQLPAGVQVAAAAWGYNLIARCFDEAALRSFYLAHHGRAPENFCSEGSPVPSSDAGPVDAMDDAKKK